MVSARIVLMITGSITIRNTWYRQKWKELDYRSRVCRLVRKGNLVKEVNRRSSSVKEDEVTYKEDSEETNKEE